MSRKIVIKFGGEIVQSPSDLENLVANVAALHANGDQLILVHGGGPYATKLSERLGIKTVMVAGRRVTDEATLEVMKMALSGVIHSDILAAFKKAKLPIASVSGISVINCHKRPPKKVSGSDEIVDFGLVGDLDSAELKLILDLQSQGHIPLISPLSADPTGQILNINADSVAALIAKTFSADAFVAVTKVGGVFKRVEDKQSRFTLLNKQDAESKISSGEITGGMIPKVEESLLLLKSGIKSVHIVGTATTSDISRELAHPGSVGTALIN